MNIKVILIRLTVVGQQNDIAEPDDDYVNNLTTNHDGRENN